MYASFLLDRRGEETIMKCPECQISSTSVYDSRPEGEVVYRRRKCNRCGHKWRTVERFYQEPVKEKPVKAKSVSKISKRNFDRQFEEDFDYYDERHEAENILRDRGIEFD